MCWSIVCPDVASVEEAKSWQNLNIYWLNVCIVPVWFLEIIIEQLDINHYLIHYFLLCIIIHYIILHQLYYISIIVIIIIIIIIISLYYYHYIIILYQLLYLNCSFYFSWKIKLFCVLLEIQLLDFSPCPIFSFL